MNLLEIEGLTKVYRKTQAVSDLNLIIEEGEFVGLIGHNGAGKSTTIKCIAGKIEPTQGKIRLEGYSYFDNPIETTKRIGYVDQRPTLFPFLTAEEYLRFIGESRGVHKDALTLQIDELLGLLDLDKHRDRLIREYSGGMEQKTAICGALIGSPKLLILDEAFVGLDPESTFNVQQLLQIHCKQGGAVILSSHIMPMLESICSRYVIMKGGRLKRDFHRETFEEEKANGGHRTLLDLYMEVHNEQESE